MNCEIDKVWGDKRCPKCVFWEILPHEIAWGVCNYAHNEFQEGIQVAGLIKTHETFSCNRFGPRPKPKLRLVYENQSKRDD